MKIFPTILLLFLALSLSGGDEVTVSRTGDSLEISLRIPASLKLPGVRADGLMVLASPKGGIVICSLSEEEVRTVLRLLGEYRRVSTRTGESSSALPRMQEEGLPQIEDFREESEKEKKKDSNAE